MTTTNEDIVKAAAHRMCAVFETKGVKVKHSLMLEALSVGFGLDGWRTLKAVIDAPRAVPVIAAPPLGTTQKWVVEAIYMDNNQQYGDDCWGRTALEAAIDAIMERLTDFGNELGIVSVSNSDESEVLSPSYITQIRLFHNREALERVLKAYNACPRKSRELHVYRNWLTACLAEYDKTDLLTELTDYSVTEGATAPPSADNSTLGFISEDLAVTPSQALLKLCECVEGDFKSVMDMEAQDEDLALAVYQVCAMTRHFELNVDDERFSILLDVEFDPVAD